MVDPLTTVAKEAGLSLVETGVLGVLLILSLVACLFLYRRCQTVQDLRVSDNKVMSKKIIEVAQELGEVALRLRIALERNTEVEQETQKTVAALKTTMETVVLSAVRERRSGRK